MRQPHLSALDTGLALVPFGAGTLVGTVVSAALYRAIGPRWVVLAAAALAVVSAWLLAQTIQPTATASQLLAAARSGAAAPSTPGPDDLRWGLFLVGLSFVMINVPTQTLALEALKGDALAKASSLFLATKFIFSSVGVAIITTVFVDHTRSQATSLVSQIQTLLPGSGLNPTNPSVLAALRTMETQQIPIQAATSAIQSIFWLICFGSIALVALALLLPGRKRQTAETQTEAEHASTEAVEVQ